MRKTLTVSSESPNRQQTIKGVGAELGFALARYVLRNVGGEDGNMTYESIPPAQTNIAADLEQLTCSAYVFILEEDRNNPILSLDSTARIAFILRHLLGYKIEDAALLADMSEEEYRTNLRSAYLQLASEEFGHDVHMSVLAEPALA